MKEEFILLHRDTPEAISDSVIVSEANSEIIIFVGKFLLKFNDKEIFFDGTIKYEWFANSGVHFYGSAEIEFENLNNISDFNDEYSVIIDNLEFGKGFITKTRFGNSLKPTIKGTISQYAILGDKTIPVNKIKFTIPNLREFHGYAIKRMSKHSISMDRLVFEDETYKFIIDKCSDFKDRKENLESKGGYDILYNGELSIKKGHLTITDTRDLFHCLSNFLTFLNGRRTSALFIQGIFEEDIIWTDYTDYFVDIYKTVISWPPKHSIADLNDIWKRFRVLWNNPDDKGFLTSLIHWYVEANSHVGFSEGSIIMAQTALELLYNWWIVEQKKMILGKDSENISASNKIRLLISQLNIPSNIPLSFSELQNFKDTTENVFDAPDAIVYIRNSIVHSQAEKRKKLSSIDYLAKYQALQIYLWYIELTLLRILDYKGAYFNRCSDKSDVSSSEESVPWQI